MSAVTPKHSSPETIERGRVRREQIVSAAAESFARGGYRGTGLTAIAQAVGVSVPGLLHHFGTKERLLEAVIRHRTDQDRPVFQAVIGDGGLTMFDRLELLAQHQVSRVGLVQLFSVLVAENLSPDDPQHAFFVSRYADLRADIARALRIAADRNEIYKGADLESISSRIIATMDGLHIQWLLDPQRVDLVRSYRDLGAALRRELRQ